MVWADTGRGVRNGSNDKRKRKGIFVLFWCGETQEEDYTVVVAIRGGGGRRLFGVGRDIGREVHGGSSDKRKKRRLSGVDRHRKRNTQW